MQSKRVGKLSIVSSVLLMTLTASACAQNQNAPGQRSASPNAQDSDDETTIRKAAGDINKELDAYRNLLGADNGGAPTKHASGRREINWDAVPDEFASPNALPSDFFNASDAPRARGIVLETPGTNVSVSADRDNPAGAAVRFGNINPTYSEAFRAFSEERLFSPIGSNIVDLRFFLPGTKTPAKVRGFGAVYTDVDKEESADFEFFDVDDKSLGKFAVPVSKDGLSFLGIIRPEADIARVRIVYGSSPLGPDDGSQYDVAVMDDFILGEPQP